MKKIESKAHPIVKRLAALRTQVKARENEKHLIVVGKECLDDLQEAFGFIEGRPGTLKVKSVFSTDQELLLKHAPKAAERLLITAEIWQKISGLDTRSGLGIELEYPSSFYSAQAPFPKKIFQSSKKILILDEIADPGNMGTLLRSAWAFGYHTVCLTPGCAHPFNDKALRAAKGVCLKLTLIQCPVEGLIEELTSAPIKCFSAHMDGKTLKGIDLKCKKRALVVGNEARGVNPALLEISEPVAIEMEPGIDSLNAAVAGSLLMWRFNV